MLNMEKQLEYTTRAGVIAEIYLQNMELEITSGEVDQTKLDLRWQAEDKMQLEDVITIEYMEDENRLKIDEKKSNIKDAQLKLTIPPESKVVAENTNGSTELSQVSGRHIIRSENGSIFARNIDGEIQLKNENGSISLQNSEGKFKLKSENGSLKAKAVSGELKLSNVNGASKVVQCSGKLKIKSENGVIRVLQAGCEKANISSVNAPIYFEFASIKHGKFEFKNENGKTQILVPEDLPYDIEAATKYGSLHVGIKGDYDSETEERTKKIQMTQGAGTVEIEVANKLGGITIIPSGKGFIRRHIDLSFITETLDNVIEKIPPEHREKAKQKFNKAKEKLHNLNFERITDDVEKVLNEVEEDLEEFTQKVSNPEFQQNLKDKVRENVEKLKFGLGVSRKTKEEVDERSRLKILQLLEDGKITTSEAERLLEAIGKNDE